MQITAAPKKEVSGWAKFGIWLAAVFTIFTIIGVAGQASGNNLQESAPSASSISAPAPGQSVNSVQKPEHDLFAASAAVGLCGSDSDKDKRMESLKNRLLPALRWEETDLSSFTGDSMMDRLMSVFSTIANAIFGFASMLWSAFFGLLSWGLLFQPLCEVAAQVNDLVAYFGVWASALLAVATVMVFWQRRRDIMNGGFTKVIAGILSLGLLFGSIFYVLDATNSVRGQDNTTVLNTKGTLPWMAAKVIYFMSTISTSMSYISDAANSKINSNGKTTAFTDSTDAMNSSKTSKTEVTCAAWDEYLYKAYAEQGKKSEVAAPGATMAMEQMSRIWEVTYLNSWITAQFGRDESGRTLTANTSCWRLERFNEAGETKAMRGDHFIKAFGDVNGVPSEQQKLQDSGFIYFIYPGLPGKLGQQVDVMMAWCGNFKDGQLSLGEGLKGTKIGDAAHCGQDDPPAPFGKDGLSKKHDNSREAISGMIEAGKTEDNCRICIGPDMFKVEVWKDEGDEGVYGFDEGGKSVENKFGAKDGENPDNKVLDYYRDWAYNWTGDSSMTRMMQSFIAVAVSILYVWSMGPVAIGLPIAGVILIMGLPLIPLALAFIAMGISLGKRIVRVVLTACAATFMFGIMITFLAAVNSVLTSMATAILKDNQGSLLGQIILGFMPIAAIFLLRKAASALNLGDMTKFSGGLGMGAGMVMNAAGEGRAFNRATNDMKRRGGALSTAAGVFAGNRLANYRNRKARAAEDPNHRSLMDKITDNKLTNALAASPLGQAVKGVGQGAAAQTKRYAGGAVEKGKAVANSVQGKIGKFADNNKALNKLKASKLGQTLTQASVKSLGTKVAAMGALTAVGAAPLAVGYGLYAGLNSKFGTDNQSVLDRLANYGTNQKAKLAASRANMDKAVGAMTNRQFEEMDPTFEPGQFVAAGIASKEATLAMETAASKSAQTLSKTADTKVKTESRIVLAQSALLSELAHTHGGKSPDGVNLDFAGLPTETAKAHIRNSLSKATGIKNWEVNDSGQVAPVPVERRSDGFPQMPKNTPLEAIANPALWLDPSITNERPTDRPGERVARVRGALTATGMYDPTTNTYANMFAKLGYDLDNGDDRAFLMEVANGAVKFPAKDARVAHIGLNKEQQSLTNAMVDASMRFSEVPRAHRDQMSEQVIEAVKSARKELEDLPERTLPPISLQRARFVSDGSGDRQIQIEESQRELQLDDLPEFARDLHSQVSAMTAAAQTAPDFDSSQAVGAIRSQVSALVNSARSAQESVLEVANSAALIDEAADLMDPDNDKSMVAGAAQERFSALTEQQEALAEELSELELRLQHALAAAAAAPPAYAADRLKEVEAVSSKLEAVAANIIRGSADSAERALSHLSAAEQAQYEAVFGASAAESRLGDTGPTGSSVRTARQLPGRKRPVSRR